MGHGPWCVIAERYGTLRFGEHGVFARSAVLLLGENAQQLNVPSGKRFSFIEAGALFLILK